MARINKMLVNMDHMRWQMTEVLNHLGRELVSLLKALPEHEREKIIKAFSDLAGYVGGLNCMYMKDNPQFNDVSEKVSVMDIYELPGNQD